MSIFTISADVSEIRKDTDAEVKSVAAILGIAEAVESSAAAILAETKLQTALLTAMAADIKAMRAAVAPAVVGLEPPQHGPPEVKI
jgi:hypothetical protein